MKRQIGILVPSFVSDTSRTAFPEGAFADMVELDSKKLNQKSTLFPESQPKRNDV